MLLSLSTENHANIKHYSRMSSFEVVSFYGQLLNSSSYLGTQRLDIFF